MFTYMFGELPLSPTVVVGSTQVQLFGGLADLAPCTQKTCPRALPSVNQGVADWVNVAPTLLYVANMLCIDRRSLLKEEAWSFLSYMQTDTVFYRGLIQVSSGVNPFLVRGNSSQLGAGSSAKIINAINVTLEAYDQYNALTAAGLSVPPEVLCAADRGAQSLRDPLCRLCPCALSLQLCSCLTRCPSAQRRADRQLRVHDGLHCASGFGHHLEKPRPTPWL